MSKNTRKFKNVPPIRQVVFQTTPCSALTTCSRLVLEKLIVAQSSSLYVPSEHVPVAAKRTLSGAAYRPQHRRVRMRAFENGALNYSVRRKMAAQRRATGRAVGDTKCSCYSAL
jgi:hypothetical protein